MQDKSWVDISVLEARERNTEGPCEYRPPPQEVRVRDNQMPEGSVLQAEETEHSWGRCKSVLACSEHTAQEASVLPE